jgi:hypothetical protein
MFELNTIDHQLYKILLDLSRPPQWANFALGGASRALQMRHSKSSALAVSGFSYGFIEKGHNSFAKNT